MSKRLPTRSSVPGFSKKSWIKFVSLLTDNECEFLHSSFNCSADHYDVSESGHFIDLACDCDTMLPSICSKAKAAGGSYKDFKSYMLSPVTPTPSPRLVGIETNPGPPKKITTVVVSKSKGTAKKSKSYIRMEPQGGELRIRAPRVPASAGVQMRDQYVRTLQDPWEYGPMFLGYDTFVTTTIGTGYARGNFTVNADGSFAVSMTPTLQGMVAYNTSGVNTIPAVYTTVNASNLDAVTENATEGRVISGGMRIFCSFPRTSAPGELYATIDVSRTTAELQTLTPQGISNLSSAELGIGTTGARGIILPIDPGSYDFTSLPLSGYGADVFASSSVVFAGLGFPVGTQVFYESILNLELLPSNAVTSVGINPNNPPSGSLSDYYPTPSNLYSSCRSSIGPSVTMDAVLDFATNIGNIYNGARRAYSLFNQGRHFNRSRMIAGASEAQRSRGSNLMIEEMKEYETV